MIRNDPSQYVRRSDIRRPPAAAGNQSDPAEREERRQLFLNAPMDEAGYIDLRPQTARR